MSLTNRVEELARSAACLDVADLPGLVRLQDELTDLAESIEDPAIGTVAEAARSAAASIEAIVLRTAEDTDATLAEVHKAIEYVQQVFDAISAGHNPASVLRPGATGPESDPGETDPELIQAWVSSCTCALAELEAAVVSIDNGDDDSGQDAEARRIIHTIKGEAGVLSFADLQTVCHDFESLIDLSRERDGGFPVEQALALVDWLRACIDAIAQDPAAERPPHEQLHDAIRQAIAELCTADAEAADTTSLTTDPVGAVPHDEPGARAPAGAPSDAALSQSESPVDAPEPVGAPDTQDQGPVRFPPEAVIDETTPEFACEAREHIANAEQSLLDLESDLGNTELINNVFRAFHTIKGVAGFMHLTPIVSLTHVAETLLDRARSGALALTRDHLDLFLRSCDVLGQLINALQDGPPPRRSTLERLVAELERACTDGVVGSAPRAPAGDEAPGAQAQPAASAPAPTEKPAAPEPKPAAQAPSDPGAARRASRVEQSVKVNTSRMDALVDMVGELVIGYQMVYQDETVQGIKAQHTQRTLTHVSKIIRDLQEVAMSLRLVTLRATFQKMARLVRDVSAKAGKQIRFHVEGEDVELDRTVVEEIADPLVHMIRNACDHGIEPAEERRAAGKAPEGNLYLRAYHQGGSIVVEIADDGRGLHRERILEKAAAKGVLPPDRDPAEMTDREVFNLIFAPGFSTAERVTDISGRGVGMDVVRRNIEALRGKVEISSTPGEGSTFKMLLPLTMAIIDGMVVRVGAQRYVIPTLSIEQSFRPGDGSIHTVLGQGEMVQVRGNMLPVYRAKSVFGLDEGVDDAADGLLVVLEAHNARFCLLVDEIVGQQQVVIKNLGHGVSGIRGVSGGAILGDGRVALILDVAGIAHQATGAAA